MTIIFTYLFWQSLASRICHPRRHNVTALFVNIVFSDKDSNKNVYQLKGYYAKHFRMEFLDKRCARTRSGINRLLNKFGDT